VRYRLIPTRGIADEARFIQAEDAHAARGAAVRLSAELGKPVLIVSHPEGSECVTPLFTVGEDPSERKVRVR
jgi:hypothetical protein